ncbi:MAG TPA: 2-dehydropantoate 2-reductase [Pararhizobium sp.]|uniref:ketopantoate reductase family protein n=1 Tax=Pararhizobium sp. TaxID=1977563 RepID=UPI002BB72E2B|nr:2-dehydropantoate 2-reductase [Pararhizobium sp.]HTO31169.1 2-dehydropantoate 2-reductase [Pararhizobium sp.]
MEHAAQDTDISAQFRSICIFGAGAIGGALAARLAASPALAGSTVSAIARGAHLQAIRKNGLHLHEPDKTGPLIARFAATDTAADLPPQDLVIVTLKGHQLTSASADIARLLKPDGRVVMIQNGIPWWYFHGDTASGLEGRQIEALDPGGLIWQRIGPERVIGGVIYQGAQMIEPGHIRLTSGGLLHLGEPSGGLSPALTKIAGLFEASGWAIKTTGRIRDELWLKLLGNAALNPISALTRARIGEIVDGPLEPLVRTIMIETKTVAERLGCHVESTIDQRLEHTRTLGSAKTSMLQDLEQGRLMEIMPLTRAITQLARMADVPTPANDMLLLLISQLDQSMAQARADKA